MAATEAVVVGAEAVAVDAVAEDAAAEAGVDVSEEAMATAALRR